MSEETLAHIEDSGPSSSLRPRPPLDLGRLRLGRLLGQGGMGQVYEAYDPHLKRSVAVKLLTRGTPEDVRRFVREAQAQAAQTHPDVCPVYEAGETGGTPYIVMKLVDGVPLDEATAEWPLESKVRILGRIVEAVHAAHRTGLVHRDLKPGNLLVEPSEDGEAKPWVLDFGLARAAADGWVTADGEALGTPGYMAPEQVRGELHALDRRTDVYALGATLYHLLAGSPPFSGAGITPARALAEDLRRYLDDVPVTARPVSSWYRFRKWTRRNQALLRLGTVFAALLLAALAWGGVTAWTARERERLARRFTEQVVPGFLVVESQRMIRAALRYRLGQWPILQRRTWVCASETPWWSAAAD